MVRRGPDLLGQQKDPDSIPWKRCCYCCFWRFFRWSRCWRWRDYNRI